MAIGRDRRIIIIISSSIAIIIININLRLTGMSWMLDGRIENCAFQWLVCKLCDWQRYWRSSTLVRISLVFSAQL